MNSRGAERSNPLEELIGSGVVVAVVGPSGAGKDSVMNHARERLGSLVSEVTFIRRIITRPPNEDMEDHDSVDDLSFERMIADHAFAVHWSANGLHYGLPVSMDRMVRAGGVVVANVSRAVIPALRGRYAHILPVIITAPSHVLAERLVARGRENCEEIISRLGRADAQELAVEGAVTISNDSDLANASEKFLAVLRKAAAWSDVGDTV